MRRPDDSARVTPGHRGPPPALTEAEIDDVVAFLGTLDDGFDPGPGTVVR